MKDIPCNLCRHGSIDDKVLNIDEISIICHYAMCCAVSTAIFFTERKAILYVGKNQLFVARITQVPSSCFDRQYTFFY